MQTVYFISGLGADERAFQFLDLSFCNPVFIRWIRPLPKETLPAYATRLLEQVKEPEPVFVGLSFGGIMAVELSKQRKPHKLIIISSISTAKEIPLYIRIMRWLPVHKFTSASFIRRSNLLAYKLMGIDKRADKVLFREMLDATDDYFLCWAIDRIINWDNKERPGGTVHIHGTRDIVLPRAFVKADTIVPGGVHLMVMNKPVELSVILKRLLTEGEIGKNESKTEEQK